MGERVAEEANHKKFYVKLRVLCDRVWLLVFIIVRTIKPRAQRWVHFWRAIKHDTPTSAHGRSIIYLIQYLLIRFCVYSD